MTDLIRIVAKVRRRKYLAGAGVASVLIIGLVAATHAQSSYPNRSVQIIVPYAAGGIADAGMRILADKLTAELKQPFVVENRPGAGGIVAAKAGASAPPDGYTLLMTGNNNAISASLFKSLPYNILTDFASTSTVSFFDLLIVTRADSPLKSIADLIKVAKANPVGSISPPSIPAAR